MITENENIQMKEQAFKNAHPEYKAWNPSDPARFNDNCQDCNRELRKLQNDRVTYGY